MRSREFAELADGYNVMADKLELAVREQGRSEGELKVANDELQQNSATLRDRGEVIELLGGMAHRMQASRTDDELAQVIRVFVPRVLPGIPGARYAHNNSRNLLLPIAGWNGLEPDVEGFAPDGCWALPGGYADIGLSAAENIVKEIREEAGLTVIHVVPSLSAALKAIEAGVDGLVVEGGEGGGFKNARDVATMVLLPLVCSKVNVPVIAAGGVVDGRTMAAAFALGAEGVQMGTRMVSAAESPVHQNWKDAIVGAKETDTVFLNRFGPGPALRALRTEKTSAYERDGGEGVMGEFARAKEMYFGGDLESSIPLTGQVAGRIDSVKPVAQVIAETVAEFEETVAEMGRRYAS